MLISLYDRVRLIKTKVESNNLQSGLVKRLSRRAVLRVNSRAVAVAEVVTKAGLEFAKPCLEITFIDEMVAAVRTSWP